MHQHPSLIHSLLLVIAEPPVEADVHRKGQRRKDDNPRGVGLCIVAGFGQPGSEAAEEALRCLGQVEAELSRLVHGILDGLINVQAAAQLQTRQGPRNYGQLDGLLTYDGKLDCAHVDSTLWRLCAVWWLCALWWPQRRPSCGCCKRWGAHNASEQHRHAECRSTAVAETRHVAAIPVSELSTKSVRVAWGRRCLQSVACALSEPLNHPLNLLNHPCCPRQPATYQSRHDDLLSVRPSWVREHEREGALPARQCDRQVRP